jgi:L-rhamnose mutarotase
VRVCFRLEVKADRLGEYRRRHEAVWPDMLAALDASGWRNYSLFLSDDGTLIGYFETDSLEAALAGMASTDVNTRWQASMAEFFEGTDGWPADEAFEVLPEVFNLADQLAHVPPPRQKEAPR